jgi:quercetin dioxygenase-like cupin family protein
MRQPNPEEDSVTLHQPHQPFVATPENAKNIWHMGAYIKFMAVGEDTGGQFWLAEQTSELGYASPVHRHTKEDEIFIVLDGKLTVQIDGQARTAAAGSAAFAPRGLSHAFQVQSPSARFLILSTPAGFERWFFQTGVPADGLTQPPAITEPPDFDALVASLAPFGVEFLAPPPGAPSGPPPAQQAGGLRA